MKPHSVRAYSGSFLFRSIVTGVSLCLLMALVAVQAQAQAALVNAASYERRVAPGSIAALFAANMTTQTEAAASLPLPTSLGGVSVRVNGVNAPIFFASPNQVNVQIPSGTGAGTAAFEVIRSGSTVASGSVEVAASSPGVFTINSSGTGQAAVLNSDYTLNADFDLFPRSRPEASGSYVVLYATGLGNTNPVVSDGLGAPSSPLAVGVGATTVMVGGRQAQVLYSGLAPGLVGLWQLNVVIPDDLPTNMATSVVITKTNVSPETKIAVANKTELASVSGSVVNALNGSAVSNASLQLQSGSKTRNVTTDANGRYSIFILNPGAYMLTAAATGFISASQNATLTGGSNQTLAPIALTPPLSSSSEYRIVLTWQNGIDLDAHLTGTASGSGRYHIWWNGESDFASPLTAKFDRDDTSGSGPETVTFTVQAGGVYRFSVQNYTDRDSNGSTRLAQFGGTVRVYRGSQQIGLFSSPSGGGTLWKVFEINNGTLSSANQLADEPDPSNIRVSY
jgi:uncharacterized protein (TIGR03437 family)